MTSLEATLLEEHLLIALDELERASGLSVEQISELVEYGVFEPQGRLPQEWRFAARSIAVARRACRLRSDFELSTPGLALALALLERIEGLEQDLNRLRAQALRGLE